MSVACVSVTVSLTLATLPSGPAPSDAMYTYPYHYGRVTTPAPTGGTDPVRMAINIYSIAFSVATIIVIVVVVCCCIYWCKRCLQRCWERCCKKKPPPSPPRPRPVAVYRAPPSPKQVQVCAVRTYTVATVQPVEQSQVARITACTVREVAVVR